MVFASILSVSCSPNEKIIKKATEEVTKLTEQVKEVKDLAEYQSIVLKFEKALPKELKDMDEEEFIKIDGAIDYVEAVARFETACVPVALKVSGNQIKAVTDLADSIEDFLGE